MTLGIDDRPMIQVVVGSGSCMDSLAPRSGYEIYSFSFKQ